MEEPEPIAEPIEQALVKILRPDLLEQYQAEKERHRQELKEIETLRKRARHFIKRFFGKVREQKELELEQEYLDRVNGENDRHASRMLELKETIRDHADPNRYDEEDV